MHRILVVRTWRNIAYGAEIYEDYGSLDSLSEGWYKLNELIMLVTLVDDFEVMYFWTQPDLADMEKIGDPWARKVEKIWMTGIAIKGCRWEW